MPKSEFWKFDSTNGPDRWIIDTHDESKKIDSMTSDELIDYIKDFTQSPPTASDIRNLFESLDHMTLEHGNGLLYYAQDIFILEMQQLFNKLKDRLKQVEKRFDFIHHFDDAKNVNAVINNYGLMAKSMSSTSKKKHFRSRSGRPRPATPASDCTVLYLVRRHMIRKQLEPTKQWKEIRKYRRDLLWFIYRLEVSIERKLNPGAVIPLSLY